MTNEDLCSHCHLPRQGAHSCMQSMQAEIERLRKQLKDCEQLLAAHDPKRECGYWMRTSPPESAERCLVAGCGKPSLVAEDGAVGGLCEEHNGNVIRPRDEGEPNKLPVDQTDIDIALETAQTIEDGGEPTAADCIRACARAAQATLGNAPEPLPSTEHPDQCSNYPDCSICGPDAKPSGEPGVSVPPISSAGCAATWVQSVRYCQRPAGHEGKHTDGPWSWESTQGPPLKSGVQHAKD